MPTKVTNAAGAGKLTIQMKTAGTKIATVTSVGGKAIPNTCVRVKPEAVKPEAAKTENGDRKVIQ